jgi:hypothetical protein
MRAVVTGVPNAAQRVLRADASLQRRLAARDDARELAKREVAWQRPDPTATRAITARRAWAAGSPGTEPASVLTRGSDVE